MQRVSHTHPVSTRGASHRHILCSAVARPPSTLHTGMSISRGSAVLALNRSTRSADLTEAAAALLAVDAPTTDDRNPVTHKSTTRRGMCASCSPDASAASECRTTVNGRRRGRRDAARVRSTQWTANPGSHKATNRGLRSPLDRATQHIAGGIVSSPPSVEPRRALLKIIAFCNSGRALASH
jgi:hypothetical protein